MDLYKQTLKKSILCENESYKHASLSNIGIIEVDKNINNFLEKIVFDYNDNLLKIKNKNKFNNQKMWNTKIMIASQWK